MNTHERLYQATLSQVRQPDVNWRVFLYLVTGYDGGRLWRRIEDSVDFQRRELTVAAIQERPWSSSERVFIDLALAMFLNEPLMFDFRDLRVLDGNHWAIVKKALDLYRAG